MVQPLDGGIYNAYTVTFKQSNQRAEEQLSSSPKGVADSSPPVLYHPLEAYKHSLIVELPVRIEESFTDENSSCKDISSELKDCKVVNNIEESGIISQETLPPKCYHPHEWYKCTDSALSDADQQHCRWDDTVDKFPSTALLTEDEILEHLSVTYDTEQVKEVVTEVSPVDKLLWQLKKQLFEVHVFATGVHRKEISDLFTVIGQPIALCA